jgi:hypothetical protein
VPLQRTSAFARGPQAWQPGPQAFTSSSGTQLLLQAWRPLGHMVPAQASSIPMHLPEHRRVIAGHLVPQLPLSQVASPPVGAVHGEQEVPQVLMSVSLTQASPQR